MTTAAAVLRGTDRAEQIGRLGAQIGNGARPSTAPCPAPGARVLPAEAHFVLKPDFYGCLRGELGRDLADRLGQVFERLDPGRVLPKMARARRDMSKPEPSPQLADRALVMSDVPAGQDLLPQIDTAPAYHAVALELGAGFDQRRQLG